MSDAMSVILNLKNDHKQWLKLRGEVRTVMKRYGNLSDPTLDISRHNYAAVLDHVTIKFPILRGLTPDPVKVVALDYLRSYHRHLNEPRKPKVNRLRRRSRVVVDA